MALWLIRHPAPQVASGLCYGRTDLPLAQSPALLLDTLRAGLPPQFRLYSSPLRRCAELAVELGETVIYEPRLMEIDFGRWEMQPWNSLGAATLDAWIASGYDAALHGGEALPAVQARVLDWLQGLPGDAEVVAVTHAGVIRLLLHWFHGWPLEHCLRLPLAFGGITCLDLDQRLAGEQSV